MQNQLWPTTFLNYKPVSEQVTQKMEGGGSGFPGMMVLNSQNYANWKIKMEDLLIVKDLYEPIDKSEIPKGVLESDWKLLNRKAMATILQCVDVSVLQHVANDTNAHEMWQKLSGLYERKNALNRTSLMRKIVNLKYRDGVERQAQHRPDRLKKPRTGSVGTDRLGRVHKPGGR
jgi:hypothetical protein